MSMVLAAAAQAPSDLSWQDVIGLLILAAAFCTCMYIFFKD